MISSVLPVAGNYEGRNRKTQLLNVWLHDWCHHQNFGVLDHGSVHVTPGWLAPHRVHLSQRGKTIFAQESAGLMERVLNYI